MEPDFMHRLQILRDRFKKPMTITSGYRCPQHPIEATKSAPGPHSTGMAADIGVQGADAHRILSIALDMNFKGIGVQQKGDKRFLHLDDLTDGARPTIWSY
jgi:uncharacterized protein YcbK (DUF882 family)